MKPALWMGVATIMALLGANIVFAADNSGSADTSASPVANSSGQNGPHVPKGPQHTNMPAARDDMPPSTIRRAGAAIPQGMPGTSNGSPGEGK